MGTATTRVLASLAASVLAAGCASSLDVQAIVPDGGAALTCWSEATPCTPAPNTAGMLLLLNAGAPIDNAVAVSITTKIALAVDTVTLPLDGPAIPPTRTVWLRFAPGVQGPCAVSVTALDDAGKPIGNAGDSGGDRLVPDRSVKVQLWLR